MIEYHKIQTAWKRNPETNYKTFLLNEWSTPEFKYLAGLNWEWTEKVDGTNIRVWIDDGGQVRYGGKTDRASIPTKLLTQLQRMFGENAKLKELGPGMVLCGEGYGAGMNEYGSQTEKGIICLSCGGMVAT